MNNSSEFEVPSNISSDTFDQMPVPSNTQCGFIALVGRPNVGKSTLLNQLLGKKISITSPKPQTTRCQILGVKTKGHKQTVWVDTPGIHLREKKALNRCMNKAAKRSLQDVNAIVFVVEAMQWTEEDEAVWRLLENQTVPVLIVVSKIDKIKDKQALLPFMQTLHQKTNAHQVIPISAIQREQLDVLEQAVEAQLPDDVFYFPEDMSSNMGASFHLSELIRERLMIYLQKEIPYSIAVQIEKIEQGGAVCHIHALIWVEREGQKRIVIGEKGEQLKRIGCSARESLEAYLQKKVNLKLWVKVKSNWASHQDRVGQLVEGLEM